MTVPCGQCQKSIPDEDINVATDVALCRDCDRVWKLSELAGIAPPPPTAPPPAAFEGDASASYVDLSKPFHGASLRQDGTLTRVTASYRNPGAWFFVLFSSIWCSITLVVFIGMLTTSAPGPIDDAEFERFADAARENARGAWSAAAPDDPARPVDPGASVDIEELRATIDAQRASEPGPDVLGLLFLLPFGLVGAVTAFAGLFGLFGRMEVILTPSEGRVWKGLLLWGRSKRFDPSAVTAVREKSTNTRVNGREKYCVALEGTGLSFGGFLPDDRRAYLAAALRQSLFGDASAVVRPGLPPPGRGGPTGPSGPETLRRAV
jgi:hypothetical protein